MQEHNPEPLNPLGMDGIEFVEYATSQPQALGAVLQMMGFVPVARHRSREGTLYRQGTMNVIVNAHPEALPGMSAPGAHPALSAVAVRVRDAEFAWRRALDLGFYLSFAGNMTYPKAQTIRDAAVFAPADRILVETDAPFLAPVPLRGQRNEPAYVAHTAAALAELRGISAAELASLTTENFFTLFPITRPPA